LLSKTTRRLALLALVPAMLLGSLMIASPASAALVSEQTLQSQIVGFTNWQRRQHGCAPVRLDPRLTAAARGHSYHMARTGAFSHTGYGGSSFGFRIRYKGYTAPLAENIAYGYPTAARTIHAWLASPGHRRNMLNCQAKAIGVGVVYNSHGVPYYTQDFGWR
jgi:uncharacterized protein YkwD